MRVYTTNKNITFRASRYWWQEQAYLTLMGQLLIDLPNQQSLSAKTFSDHTYPELAKIQADATFDKGKPKRQAEFLVAGYAYSYDDKTTHCTVQIRVGALEKQLNVYGDRYWLKSGPIHSMSQPLPFSRIALAWTNAFGGKAWPLNPTGKGIDSQEQHYPLPNIDIAYDVITSPHQRPAPVGFLPLWTSKTQQTQLGTFDDQWIKKSWPYLPVDHNFDYWNGAPLDQQQANFWTGTEAITCVNMHPAKQSQYYQLAGHKLRAFYQKKGQAPAELLLNFDTIWVLPHLEQVVLMWHGTMPIIDETAFDIEGILIAEENQHTGTFTAAHYFNLLEDKINRKPPPIIAAEPKPATKLSPNPELEKKLAAANATNAALMAQQESDKVHMQRMLDDAIKKLKPEQQAMLQKAMSEPPPPSPIDPTLSMADTAAAMIALVEAKLGPKELALFKEAQNKPALPTDFNHIKQQLKKMFAQPAVQKGHGDQLPMLLDTIDRLEEQEKHSQQQNAAQEALERERPKTVDEKIAKALQEKCFKNMLIADHRFEGIIFDGIQFEMTTFRQCQFYSCTFNQCTAKQFVFDQCDIEKNSFTACQLVNFLWLKTTLKNSTFHDCQFNALKTNICTLEEITFDTCTFLLNHHQETTWQDCCFNHCSESNSSYKKNTCTKNTWQECALNLSHFTECTLNHCQFFKTQWQTVSFTKNTMATLYLEQSQGTHVIFDHCQIDNWSCKKIIMPSLQIKNSQVTHWQVVDSQFIKLSCQHACLTNIEWSHSDFNNSRFLHLTPATNWSLEHVLLVKSSVNQCDFDYLQVSHCDIAQNLWNRCTIINSQWTANNAIASRFFDCIFKHSFLTNSNFYKGSFKRSFFINASINDCNLVRVNFYHASAQSMTMKDNLLPDPLPIGFWEQWREVSHD